MKNNKNCFRQTRWSHLAARIALAALMALTALVTFSDNRLAWAGDCPNGRCYATAYTDVPDGTGAKANWYLRKVIAPDGLYLGVANQNMWALTDLTENMEWVEVGNFDGSINDPAGPWRGYFWGERVDGFGTQSYAILSPALGASGTAHTFEVREISRDAEWVTYRVYIDDQAVINVDTDVQAVSVQSTSNWVRRIRAGLETSNQDATVGVTRLNSVQYRDQSYTWYPLDAHR